jgi:hypothetical protein
MKLKYLSHLITAVAFSLLLLAGTSYNVLGQGKGGGKGGGGGSPRGGPPGQQQKMENPNRGGGPPAGRGGGWQRQQQQPVFRQPAPQQRPVFRQPAAQQQPAFRIPPGQARRQQPINNQPAPQVWRQERRVFRQSPQANIPAPAYQNPGQGRGRVKREERIYSAPPQRQIPWAPGWVPPGQIRSAEAHQRNAIRKALKEQEKLFGLPERYAKPYYAPYNQRPGYEYRDYRYSEPYAYAPAYQYVPPVYIESYSYRGGGYLLNSPLFLPNAYVYAPLSTSYYYPDYYSYASPYYGYDDGRFDWKSILVRALIGFVLGNVNDDYYGPQPYSPYYAYYPAYNDYGGYPLYSSYYPASYSTRTAYVQPIYDYAGYPTPLFDVLPYDALFGPSYGGYSTDIYREILAQGYEQGFQAGWYARENRLREEYVNSLYRREDDYYDPYSYTIGENRRCFSAGYSLGYQDALYGRQDYFSEYGGNTDLVSLLLSNVIGTV